MGKKKYVKAIPYLLTALEEIPNHPVVISNLAVCYYESGDRDAAARTVSNARERGIQSAELDNVSGLLELRRGNSTQRRSNIFMKPQKKIRAFPFITTTWESRSLI